MGIPSSNMAQSQTRFDCTYCSRAFRTKGHLALHQTSLACNKSNFKENEIPKEDTSSTEQTTREMLDSINKFMKKSETTSKDFDKMMEESKKELENFDTTSKAIKDFDLSVPILNSKDTYKVPAIVQQSQFKAPKPPPSLPPSLPKSRTIISRHPGERNSFGLSNKFQPLQCIYCGKHTKERISLAKHMISEHWNFVREKQGGGRRDNSYYYANIEDNRVLKPTSKSIFNAPRPNLPTHTKSSSSLYIKTKNPKWLRNLKTAEETIPFEKLLDLPKDDSEACDVCDDDFNWPDVDHQCAKTLKKQNLQSVGGIDSLNAIKEIPAF